MTQTIAAIVSERAITEVLHFTTNKGLLGMVATDQILPRKRLSEDKYLEHVFEPNCQFRRDTAWLDYVNLSLTNVNLNLLNVSSRKWHSGKKDVWWCVLSLSPELLSDPGVYFTTTNNFYSGVHRAKGADGLIALFGPRVHKWEMNYETRTPRHRQNQPTCKQAEALYPGPLPLKYLRAVYVNDPEHLDQIEGIRAGCLNSRAFTTAVSAQHLEGYNP